MGTGLREVPRGVADVGGEQVQARAVAVPLGVLDGQLEQVLGLARRAHPARPECGPLQVGAGPGSQVGALGYVRGTPLDGVEEVLGDDHGEVVTGVGQCGEVVCRGEVPDGAVATGLGRVRDLPDHRLDEPVLTALGTEPVGLHHHDLLAAQRLQHALDVLDVGAQREQALDGEGHAQDAGVGDDLPLRRGQRIEAGSDQGLERRRCADHVEVQVGTLRGDVPSFPGDDEVTVDQRPHRLHGEQRDPFGPVHQGRPRDGGKARHQAVDELAHGDIVERVEAHHARPAPTQRRTSRQQLGTGQGQDEDGRLGSSQEMIEEVQEALVGVVGVVDHQHDHVAHSAEVLQERRPRREQVLSRERRRAARTQQHGQPRA